MTLRTAYLLERELPEDVYQRLILEMVDHEDWFGLFWYQVAPDAGARAVWRRLKPLQIEHRRVEIAPGHGYTVITYRASRKALPFLLDVKDIFSWRHPDLPEDLFFGSDKHGVALVSKALHREAWLLRRRYVSFVGRAVTLEKQRLSEETIARLAGQES